MQEEKRFPGAVAWTDAVGYHAALDFRKRVPIV